MQHALENMQGQNCPCIFHSDYTRKGLQDRTLAGHGPPFVGKPTFPPLYGGIDLSHYPRQEIVRYHCILMHFATVPFVFCTQVTIKPKNHEADLYAVTKFMLFNTIFSEEIITEAIPFFLIFLVAH